MTSTCSSRDLPIGDGLTKDPKFQDAGNDVCEVQKYHYIHASRSPIYSPAFIFITGNHKGLPYVPRAKISRDTYHSRLILPITNRDHSVNRYRTLVSPSSSNEYPTLGNQKVYEAYNSLRAGSYEFFSLSFFLSFSLFLSLARATIHALYSHLRSIFLDATACCTRCGTVSRIFIRPRSNVPFRSPFYPFFPFSIFSSSSFLSPSLPACLPSSLPPPLGVTFFSPRSFSHRHPPHLLTAFLLQ